MLLKVNTEKLGVAYITYGIKFLGYGGYWNWKIRRIIPTAHKKSRDRLKQSLKEILPVTGKNRLIWSRRN